MAEPARPRSRYRSCWRRRRSAAMRSALDHHAVDLAGRASHRSWLRRRPERSPVSRSRPSSQAVSRLPCKTGSCLVHPHRHGIAGLMGRPDDADGRPVVDASQRTSVAVGEDLGARRDEFRPEMPESAVANWSPLPLLPIASANDRIRGGSGSLHAPAQVDRRRAGGDQPARRFVEIVLPAEGQRDAHCTGGTEGRGAPYRQTGDGGAQLVHRGRIDERQLLGKPALVDQPDAVFAPLDGSAGSAAPHPPVPKNRSACRSSPSTP